MSIDQLKYGLISIHILKCTIHLRVISIFHHVVFILDEQYCKKSSPGIKFIFKKHNISISISPVNELASTDQPHGRPISTEAFHSEPLKQNKRRLSTQGEVYEDTP